MAAVPCDKCGQKMSAEALVCPHCGARRVSDGKVKMTKDELAALVAVTAPGHEDPRGLWKTLLWPHPETTGVTRTIEVMPTIACLPLVLCGLGTIGLGRTVSRNRVLITTPGEYGAATFMSLVGSIGLVWWLHADPLAWPLVAAEVAMLWVRAYVRQTSSRSHRLTAVEKTLPRPQQSVPKLIAPAPPPPSTPSTGSEPTLLK